MKQLIKKLLREALEFSDESKDSPSGQENRTLYLHDDGGRKLMAYADYTIYNDKVYIDMIEAMRTGRGYGKMVMRKLADMYGYENLERSNLTPAGVRMRQDLDKEYNFDYEQNKIDKSKNLKMDVVYNIKIPMIRNFLLDMIKNGYSETWEEYLKNPEFRKMNDEILPKYDIDFNDVAEISRWVLGSKTNDNRLEDEAPHHVLQDLAKIYKI